MLVSRLSSSFSMEKLPYLGRELLRWRVGRSTFLALPSSGRGS